MAKTDYVELPDGSQVKILHEDRSVLAIDKPPGWMLGPEDEEHVRRNLHIALTLGIEAGLWWARCRSLKFVRFIHRLDAPTTGVLLMAKSRGALAPFGKLFATRLVEKTYLAITDGIPREKEWTCTLPLGADPAVPGKHRIDREDGKESETRFRVLETRNGRALVEAYPRTGRTHQIRLHLLAAGCPVAGDLLYGKPHPAGLALRAVELAYPDPFTHRPIRIRAERAEFEKAFGFGPITASPAAATPPTVDGAGIPAPQKPVPAVVVPQPTRNPAPPQRPAASGPRPDRPRHQSRPAQPNPRPNPPSRPRPSSGPVPPQGGPAKKESRGPGPVAGANHGKRRRRG